MFNMRALTIRMASFKGSFKGVYKGSTGASIIIYTILGVPYYKYSIVSERESRCRAQGVGLKDPCLNPKPQIRNPESPKP